MSDVTEAMLENLDDEESRKLARACTAKHTKYQPTGKEFCCPKCGAECDKFCVDDSPNLDCPLMHDDDSLVCYGEESAHGCPASYATSGKAFAANLVKKKGLKPCPHCKGKGYVAGKKS